jgi:TolB-like protein
MSTFRELRQRRFVQILIAYLAASWVVIEVISQLVEHDLLPLIVYKLTLVWFLGGLPGAAVVAWFHGEQGRQKAPRSEIAFIILLIVALGGFTIRSVSTYTEERRAVAGADEGGLPASRIAVLYLDDRSRGNSLGAVADAFTEDLIAELARVPELDVVSANGVRPFRDDEADAAAVARALGAGTIVLGSVGESRDGVAVDLALVDGASGAVFRRTSLEVPLAELLEGGARLARESATLLRERLGEEVRLRETRRETNNTVAWSLLQQGRRAMKDAEGAIRDGQGEVASAHYVAADSLLERAAALDAAWARPVALRSEIAYRRARLPAELIAGLPHTLAAIRHGDAAVARNAADAGALEARGTARYWRWLTDPDLEGAVRNALLRSARDDLEGAVQRDPRRASAFSTLSHLYYNDPDAPGLTSVLMAAQRAYEEDAYVESAANVLWRIHTAALDIGQFPPAQNACQEGQARFPDDYRFRLCRIRLMATPALAADPAEGWRLMAEADSLAPDRTRAFYNVENRMFMAAVLHRAGLADSARATLARAARDADDPRMDPHRDLWLREAIVRSRIGEAEQAVDLVRRYLVANPGHRFDQGYGLSWWWRELEPEPSFRRLLALQTQTDH